MDPVGMDLAVAAVQGNGEGRAPVWGHDSTQYSLSPSVALVNSHTDQGHRWKSVKPCVKRLFSAAAGVGIGACSLELRPIASCVAGTELVEDRSRRRQPAGDESLRQVMLINCWGQS
ncbi:hypothetical protein Ancab_011000 [Ancistrocladus abbreviatus]